MTFVLFMYFDELFIFLLEVRDEYRYKETLKQIRLMGTKVEKKRTYRNVVQQKCNRSAWFRWLCGAICT